MVKLAINPQYIKEKFGGGKRSEEEIFHLCADAGFMEYDYSPAVMEDGWEETVRRIADYIGTLGGQVHQTHAPFNRYKQEDRALFTEHVRRLIKASSILGAKYVVIHADEYVAPEGKEFAPEDALAYIVEFYRPLVEYAASLGITTAVENLFEDGFRTKPGARSRYTHYVEEVIAVMDAFQEYNAGCCWDYGHGHVAYGNKDVEAAAKVASRIVCTHVHDNYYGKDLHCIPYTGQVDWAAHMKLLRDAGYRGNLSLELVYGRYPDELVPEMLRFAHASAVRLQSEM